MKILLSINPEYVERIFSGIKKYEYRKKIFKNKNVGTIVIYSTYPVKKIVGEFEIEKIIKNCPKELWNLTSKTSGIEESKFKKYFTGKNEGYAIKIGKIIKYEIPKELEEFSIKIAPQSFQYLYEQEEKEKAEANKNNLKLEGIV